MVIVALGIVAFLILVLIPDDRVDWHEQYIIEHNKHENTRLMLEQLRLRKRGECPR